MGTQNMLKINRRNTLWAIFQVISVAANYRGGQKQLKKIALHRKYTLARPPIIDQKNPGKLSNASPGNPVGITKPSSLLSFATG